MTVRLAVTLSLLSLLAAPVWAQTDDRVELRFTVTIYGEAPQGESLVSRFGEGGGTNIPGGADFCGTRNTPGCTGGARVYSGDAGGGTITVSRGAEVTFYFYRTVGDFPEGDVDRFAGGTRTIDQDTTIGAYYDYDTGRGGLGTGPNDQQGGDVQNDQQTGSGGDGQSGTGSTKQPDHANAQDDAPTMPSTGAGALAPAGAPSRWVVVMLPLLLVGLCVAGWRHSGVGCRD